MLCDAVIFAALRCLCITTQFCSKLLHSITLPFGATQSLALPLHYYAIPTTLFLTLPLLRCTIPFQSKPLPFILSHLKLFLFMQLQMICFLRWHFRFHQVLPRRTCRDPNFSTDQDRRILRSQAILL